MLILHHSRVRYINEALYSFPGFFVTLSSFFRIYCRFEGREFRGLGLKLSFGMVCCLCCRAPLSAMLYHPSLNETGSISLM